MERKEYFAGRDFFLWAVPTVEGQCHLLFASGIERDVSDEAVSALLVHACSVVHREMVRCRMAKMVEEGLNGILMSIEVRAWAVDIKDRPF